MSDKLREAAHLIRTRWENRPVDIDPTDLFVAAYELPKAYLAEHPDDEDEPVTREWLASLPATYEFCSVTGFHVDRGCGFKVRFVFAEDGGYEIFINTICIYDGLPQRRRDVRRLLAALGIEVTK